MIFPIINENFLIEILDNSRLKLDFNYDELRNSVNNVYYSEISDPIFA